MKNFKKVLALVLAVATLLSFATIASASVADFNDSKDVKHTEAVDILSTIGVLNGYKDGSYKPGRVITRAEAAKIIAMFDNGDTNIKELYAPVNFTDVASNHWAQSYISYCYHTGIIAGVGNNKYAPEAEVTGVQFLKMVLVVLGFDAKEEGLVGTGYSVRARNLAREVGLLEGIGNDFDYTKGLTRDNAAQIMLNALRTSTVKYGKVVDLNKNNIVINDSKAYYTGEALAKEWNLFCVYGQDAFGRPGHVWYWFHTDHAPAVMPDYDHAKDYKYTVGVYPDAALATYTTAVAGCDIYDDTGLKGEFITYTDGVCYTTYDHTAKKWLGTEVVVDKANDWHGAQGQLTEVYAVRGEFGKVNAQIIVHINTYLGQVTKVNAEKKDAKGHVTEPRSVNMTVWFRSSNNDYNEGTTPVAVNFTKVYTDNFDKGDYVLVNGIVDGMTENAQGIPTFTPVILNAAKTEVAQLTSVDNISNVAKLGVNKTETPVAVKYAYAADRGVKDVGARFTFIYDAYGNVIGTVPYADPLNYAVLDKLYIDYTKGIATVYATIVMPDGSKAEDVVVNKVTFEGNKPVTAWEWIADMDDDFLKGYGQQFQWAGSMFYTRYFYGRMVNYVKNENGSYNLTVPAEGFTTVANAVIRNGLKYILTYNVATGNLADVVVKVGEETKFLFQEGTTPKSTYTTYTGVDKLPNLTYSTIQFVDQDGDGVAEFVFVFNPEFANTFNTVVYTGAEAKYELGVGYTYNVKVVGEDGKMTDAALVCKTALFDTTKPGLYKVTVDASGVAIAADQITAGKQLTKTSVAGVYTYDAGAEFINMADVTFYNFRDNTTTIYDLDGETVVFLTKSGKIFAAVLF